MTDYNTMTWLYPLSCINDLPTLIYCLAFLFNELLDRVSTKIESNKLDLNF